MYDIRFLEVSDFFSFLLDHFVLEMLYIEPVGTNLYGTHNCGYFKLGSTLTFF